MVDDGQARPADSGPGIEKMPVILFIVAIALFVAAYQNNLAYLGTQLETDFPGWFKWALAIAAIAALGAIPKARPIATGLLALVLIVIVIKNQGVFSNLQTLSPIAPPAAPASPAAADVLPNQIQGTAGGGGGSGAAAVTGGVVGTISNIPVIGGLLGGL